MASLSLPRVLQLKKNSLDAEREHFEKFQTLAIQKAINSVETPVKEKHVRSTLIGTFQEQSAITYWMVAHRLPLQDNRIAAWKFCHVTHKVLREGHPACLDDSQRHVPMIENLGKLWVHLREGYGKLIHLYSGLLATKLKFHARNPRFPGNMHITGTELDNIAENDVNNYFQLCVELFDYMDDLLNLQAAVFDSLGNARANSMTASGQCRLAALIPCAQDSSRIYDTNVRLLFRLHASLPPDTLAGHRERFRTQFRKLSQFYKHASSLQYYRNLLSLPVLPANPPNFLQQSDFGTYVAPVVSVPDQPPDEPDAVGSLIDTTDTISQVSTPDWEVASSRAPTPPPDPLFERDRLIEHLQNELRRMRMDASQMSQERNVALGSLREHCSALEAKLQDAKYELEEEKQKTEVLIVQTPEIKQKLAATEEKAKVTDEKFQKLKGAYTQLREEHIALIRQKAEVDKAAAALRAASAAHDSARVALQQQLSDRNKDVELLQQSASSSEEIEAYKSELANLRTDLEQSRQKEVELETLRASMDALEIDYKTATTEQEQKIATIENELKEVSESLEKTKLERDEKESELNKVKEELVCLRENSGNEYKKVVEQKEAALKQVAELTQQYQQEKEAQASSINSLQEEIGSLQEKHINTETSFANKCKELSDELEAKNQALDITLTQNDGEIKEALEKLAEVEVRLVEMENSKNSEINELHLKIEERLNEISSLQAQVDERADLCEKFKNENTEIQNTVSELQVKLEENNTELQNLNSQLLEATSCLDQRNAEIEALRQNSEHSVIALKDKLQTVIDLKDENIKGLKDSIAEKDEQVISLNVEVSRLQLELNRLEEDLNEAQAELEIGKNEFVTLNEEHENFIQRNDSNLILKNQELRSLNDEVSKLSEEKTALIAEKETLCSEFALEKQVLENKLKDVEDAHKETVSKCEIIQNEKDDIIQKNNEEGKELKAEYDQIVETKDTEVKTLHEKIADQETAFDTKLSEKDNTIVELEKSVEELKAQLEALQTSKQKEKEETDEVLLRREKDSQILEARLSHSDTERLTAECELQDLLQHNAVLEADLAAARAQLNVARGDLEAQRVALVRSAGGAALRATESARAGLAAGPQDAAKAAADGAEGALGVLASKTELKDNEEAISQAALSAAHHAAALAAYVADVATTVTEADVADIQKYVPSPLATIFRPILNATPPTELTADCRSLLSATHSCLEPISNGLPAPAAAAEEARAAARRAWRGAAAADKPLAVRSVDDELADMDRAIEDAATQIEELLAASRAGDTGVKLEVNGNILDACTTLMGAVKVLVRDARALQRELGDPKTRETVYRKNPQWSEGLISAAKAVVFAAKLLVTSADEAVGAGGGGRMEGVSAAAHEVAGSTAQLVAASRARAPPAATGLTKLTTASRAVAAATGALVAAVRAAAAKFNDQEALDTSSLTLTATRRLEMESKVRSLELEVALDAERARLAALRKRHYHLAQMQENGDMANGKE